MASITLPDTLPADLPARLAAQMAPFRLIEGWGVQLEDLAPGQAVLRAGPSEVLLNPGTETVNGGVLATLADMACALALCTAFGGEMPFATSDLHIRYLEPAQGAVRVEARVIRLSNRGSVLECTLTSGDEAVALCTCHFALHLRDRR